MPVCTTFITMLALALSTPLGGEQIVQAPPRKINRSQSHIFYLHGQIIEEQGAQAVSKAFGRYRYGDILLALAARGACVISEVRPRGTDPMEYARKVSGEVDSLLRAGVAPGRIMVVGASKGAGIAVLASHMLKNPELKFVVMAICNAGMAAFWKKNGVKLWGRILYIYDSSDTIAGSCRPFMEILKDRGLKQFKELELKLGLGHGFIYGPYREWVDPALNWME